MANASEMCGCLCALKKIYYMKGPQGVTRGAKKTARRAPAPGGSPQPIHASELEALPGGVLLPLKKCLPAGALAPYPSSLPEGIPAPSPHLHCLPAPGGRRSGPHLHSTNSLPADIPAPTYLHCLVPADECSGLYLQTACWRAFQPPLALPAGGRSGPHLQTACRQAFQPLALPAGGRPGPHLQTACGQAYQLPLALPAGGRSGPRPRGNRRSADGAAPETEEGQPFLARWATNHHASRRSCVWPRRAPETLLAKPCRLNNC
jgi:hypothetical protein